MNIVIPSRTTRRPSSRRWSASAGLLLLAIVSCGPGGMVCLAEDGPPAAINDNSAPQLSRDAWRQRVQEAKRRAREIAIDRRNHPELYLPPPPPDPEIEATERVLNDDSLQRGDIVSTKKGLFVFRGRVDQQRRDDDFVRIPSR